MSLKETFHLPSAALEVEFMGDPAEKAGLGEFRTVFKQTLMKRLVADGVAFQEKVEADQWKGPDGTVSRVEGVVDAWILERKHRCSKSKDRHSGKAWWILECEEQVSIMMLPAALEG